MLQEVLKSYCFVSLPFACLSPHGVLRYHVLLLDPKECTEFQNSIHNSRTKEKSPSHMTYHYMHLIIIGAKLW